MTLHSAKGLEFDYVFLPGWEEGIFPNQRNIDEYGNKGLEEERRLAYVGITRARKKLFISFVNFRKQYNYNLYRSIPSRFVSELPKKSCNLIFEKNTLKSDRKLLKFCQIIIFQLVILFYTVNLVKENTRYQWEKNCKLSLKVILVL